MFKLVKKFLGMDCVPEFHGTEFNKDFHEENGKIRCRHKFTHEYKKCYFITENNFNLPIPLSYGYINTVFQERSRFIIEDYDGESMQESYTFLMGTILSYEDEVALLNLIRKKKIDEKDKKFFELLELKVNNI